MAKFVIFATARTGSTSLAELLGKSKDVKLCFEPFHEKYSKRKPGNKNYSKLVKDEVSLNKALDEIFTRFNALKVLDYQLPENIYFELLSRKDIKIIFLRRKNLLELGISDLVAHQVKEWRKTKKLSLYKNLKPLDLDKMEKLIRYVRHMNKAYLQFLEKNRKGDYMPLWYEELYSEDFEKNKKTIKKICDYLEIALPSDTAIKKYMTPSIAKINFQNIYRRIPNYEEIVKRFGNLLS